jgi:hypothetical protein
MAQHAFNVGDRVRLVGASSANSAEAFLDFVAARDRENRDEIWEVTRLLPADDLGFQYHVRAVAGGIERLVRERQLAPAEAVPAGAADRG